MPTSLHRKYCRCVIFHVNLIIQHGCYFGFRAFTEVLEGSFKQFLLSWYMFLFQLPYLPEMWLKANDFDQVDTWFNRQHLPDVSRKVI